MIYDAKNLIVGTLQQSTPLQTKHQTSHPTPTATGTQ